MKIQYAFNSKSVSTDALVSDCLLTVPLPDAVKTAVNAGKDVWYLSSAYAANSVGRENANKKLYVAVKQGYPNFEENTISQIKAIENILGAASTSLSGQPAVFAMRLVHNAIDPVTFAFRRLEVLESDPDLGLLADVAFFIPE